MSGHKMHKAEHHKFSNQKAKPHAPMPGKNGGDKIMESKNKAKMGIVHNARSKADGMPQAEMTTFKNNGMRGGFGTKSGQWGG